MTSFTSSTSAASFAAAATAASAASAALASFAAAACATASLALAHSVASSASRTASAASAAARRRASSASVVGPGEEQGVTVVGRGAGCRSSDAVVMWLSTRRAIVASASSSGSSMLLESVSCAPMRRNGLCINSEKYTRLHKKKLVLNKQCAQTNCVYTLKGSFFLLLLWLVSLGPAVQDDVFFVSLSIMHSRNVVCECRVSSV